MMLVRADYPKWIGVDDERKPLLNQKCLVFCRMKDKSGLTVSNVAKTQYHPGSGTDWPYLAPGWKVTHWMPSPSDPEE